jgi:peptide deformylase
MIRDVLIYPDKKIHTIAADLREFDDALIELIQDMKDTMDANGVDALAATQIGVVKPVILLREEDGSFFEIINPRELSKKGMIPSTEATLYYPGIETDVMRFEEIKIVYQDRSGNQQFLTATGERSITLQRKIDYCFGATLVNRIKPKAREGFERQVGVTNQVADVCPTQPLKRDFVISFVGKLLFLEFLTLFCKLFNFQTDTLQSFSNFDVYVSIAVAILLVVYLVVGHKESKIYTNCSSCQLSYVFATMMQYGGIAIVLFTLSRYLVTP